MSIIVSAPTASTTGPRDATKGMAGRYDNERRAASLSYRALAAATGRDAMSIRAVYISTGLASGESLAVTARHTPGTYAGLAERDARIHELRAGGLTHRQIAAAVGCSRTTVARAIHGRLAAEGNVLRKTGCACSPPSAAAATTYWTRRVRCWCCDWSYRGVALGVTLSNSADGHRRSACHQNG